MSLAIAILLVMGAALPDALTLDVDREPAAVDVGFRLVTPLPEEMAAAVASGAETRLVYPLRVKAKRRGWWDRRLWSGELVTIVAFDPVTGRFRCEVILDGVIIESGEAESIEEAHNWLTTPPPIRIELPEARRDAILKVRVRVIYSSGTTWLIFPTQDASAWAETILEPLAEPAETD